MGEADGSGEGWVREGGHDGNGGFPARLGCAEDRKGVRTSAREREREREASKRGERERQRGGGGK